MCKVGTFYAKEMCFVTLDCVPGVCVKHLCCAQVCRGCSVDTGKVAPFYLVLRSAWRQIWKSPTAHGACVLPITVQTVFLLVLSKHIELFRNFRLRTKGRVSTRYTALIFLLFPQWNLLKYVCARWALLSYSFWVDLNVSGCNLFVKPTSMVNICHATSPTWEVFSLFFRKVSAYFQPRVTRLVGCGPKVCLRVEKVLLQRLLGALVRAISTCWRLLLYKHMLRVDPPLIRLISRCLKHKKHLSERQSNFLLH